MSDHLDAVASLGDGVRRALYDHVVSRGAPVSRDEAAGAVGVQRTLAAYHLDKLAAHGLLAVHYERPPGRGGPGAGRPAKWYTRANDEIDVSLPPRHYDVAAELLAAAVEEAKTAETVGALRRVARRLGREIGGLARAGGRGRARQRAALFDALRGRGYEPYVDEGGAVRLRNCPFHRLSAAHTDLVCGMNLAIMEGVLDEAPALALTPALDPRPGECCVVFRPTSS